LAELARPQNSTEDRDIIGDAIVDAATLAWTLLLATPVAALALRALIGRLRPGREAVVAAVLAIILASVVLPGWAGIRFVPLIANIWTLAAAYFAYCFLVFCIARLPLRGMARASAMIIGALPIAFGYFLGSVGLLGLMFVIGSYAKPPEETMRLTANLVCTRIEGGGPSGGYELHVHREWLLTPLLHREVAVIGAKNEYEGWPVCAELRGRQF
jgi:hypothetical protein